MREREREVRWEVRVVKAMLRVHLGLGFISSEFQQNFSAKKKENKFKKKKSDSSF